MIAQPPPLTSPLPVADPLAGLLVALDRKGVTLLLGQDGQPRAKLPPGQTLDAETRALLGANRTAILRFLQLEAELWRLGRLAQAGDQDAYAEWCALLWEYETMAGI